MSPSRKRFLIPAAIVMTIAFTPMLTACGGNPLQTIVDQATGGKVDLGAAHSSRRTSPRRFRSPPGT